MGSGCIGNTSGSKACVEKISAECVLYVGESIPSLGVCQNDTINETTALILSKLQTLATGEGITLSDITANCAFVTQSLANKDKNLSTLLQILFDNDCALNQLIVDLQNNIDAPYSFDLKCLSVANPTRDNITQELITQLCSLQTTVNNIVNQLANPETDDNTALIAALTDIAGNLLGTNISSCPTSSIQKTGQGANTMLKMVGFVPIGGVIEYNGSLGNFDQTGKGLASACMDNWALCNGQNGTKNKLGLVTAMATNIQGASPLASAIIAGDNDTLTNVGNIKGTPKVTLTSVNQIPDHFHVLNINPHSHNITTKISGNGGGGSNAAWNNSFGSSQTITTDSVTVSGSVGSIVNRTASQAIENRQPTYYGIFIQRIS